MPPPACKGSRKREPTRNGRHRPEYVNGVDMHVAGPPIGLRHIRLVRGTVAGV